MTTRIWTLTLVLLGSLLSACEKSPEAPVVVESSETSASPAREVSLDQQAATAWWLGGGDILARSLTHARDLQVQVSDFLDAPDSAQLQQAQQTWQLAAEAYRGFYAHHFVALSDTNTFHILAEIDFRIGAWPVQPGSLDSWGSYLYSGLVHDIGNPLTMENLLNLHGQVDSENATLGLFAIEYMLFGENGSRTIEDYTSQNKVTAEFKERGFNSPSELPNNRRRMLLTLQTGKLVEDLQLLVDSWSAEGPASQLTVWNSLSDAKKERVLTAAFERGLAQLLVVKREEAGETHSMLIALQALRPLPALIQHKKAAAIEEQFSALEASLQEAIADAEGQLDWQTTLGRLTDMAKLFAPPLPQTPTAAEAADEEAES